MKLKIKTYTFNPTAKTIVFNDYSTIKQDGIIAIINTTAKKEIYNPLKQWRGGSVGTGSPGAKTLTLEYDTSAMGVNDKLMIMYEDDSKSIFDIITTTYNYLVSMYSNFLIWWNIATNWKSELDQARQTARDITDQRWIPALDKILWGVIWTAPRGFAYYSSDYVSGYYDYQNISIWDSYLWKAWDRVYFTYLWEWATVKSVNTYAYWCITLEKPLSQAPQSYETLTIYRELNPLFNSDWTQRVWIAGSDTGGGGSWTALASNRVNNINSWVLYFTSYGAVWPEFYGIDQFDELTINFGADTTWGGYYIDCEASTDWWQTWEYAYLRSASWYSSSWVSQPGWYTFDCKSYNAVRFKCSYSTNPSYYTTITIHGKPVGKTVQMVELPGWLSGNMSCLQSTSPWKIWPYISNLYNNTSAQAANAVITGSAINVSSFAEIYFSIFTLQDSADNGLILEQGYDTTTWYPIKIPEKILAMAVWQNRDIVVPVNMNYFRFRYTNGSVATGTPFAIRVFGSGSMTKKQDFDRNGNAMIRQPDLPTYSACTALFTPGGNTDVWDFYGVANREIQIQKIIVSGIATAWTLTNAWAIQKKSTANSWGTSTSPNKVPLSSTMTASTATIRSYIASPSTIGTVLWDVWKKAVYIPPSTGSNNTPLLELDFSGNTGLSPITLNTALEWIALNLWGVSVAGLQLQVTVLYTESFYL